MVSVATANNNFPQATLHLKGQTVTVTQGTGWDTAHPPGSNNADRVGDHGPRSLYNHILTVRVMAPLAGHFEPQPAQGERMGEAKTGQYKFHPQSMTCTPTV